jgi:hypothetical protein
MEYLETLNKYNRIIGGMRKLISDIDNSKWDSIYVYDENKNNDGLKWILDESVIGDDTPEYLTLGMIYETCKYFINKDIVGYKFLTGKDIMQTIL